MYKKYLQLPLCFFCFAFAFCYAFGLLIIQNTMTKSERVRLAIRDSKARAIAELREARKSPPVGASVEGIDQEISQLREENQRLLSKGLERTAQFSTMEYYVGRPVRASLILAAASTALLIMFLVPYRRFRAKKEHIKLLHPTS